MISRIIPLLLLLIAIGLFLGYVHPTYTGNIASLSAEIKSYDNALAAAAAFKQKEEDVRKELADIPPDALSRIESFLPDGVDNVQLILDLNALANRTGMRLDDFNIEVPKEDTEVGRLVPDTGGAIEMLEISVSGLGSYSAFLSFLEGVEWSLRPLDLVEVNISDSDTGIYLYAMTFRIYWLP